MAIIKSPLGANAALTGTAKLFDLGAVAIGSDNTEWVYVKSTETFGKNAWVAVDELFNARLLGKTEADDGHTIAVADGAGIASGEYGWVAVKGKVTALVKASCAPDVALFTSATDGALDDASTSQTEILGVVITSTAGGSLTNAVSAILNYPHVNL